MNKPELRQALEQADCEQPNVEDNFDTTTKEPRDMEFDNALQTMSLDKLMEYRS